MSTHDLSTGGDVLDRVTRFAGRAARAYGCAPASTVRLLNVSENATYLVEDPGQGPCILRVHRLGYHTQAEIESELAWMDALRAEAGVRTPRVLPAPDGQRVLALPDVEEAPDPAAGVEPGSLRHCVRFEYLPGTEPADDDAAHFAELGEITARMHRHARQWARPAWFTRFSWDYDAAFGPHPRWGRWQDGIGVGPAEQAVLGRLDQVLAARLARFGTGPERFGLVHADTRLANLLVDGGRVSVIDFDDSGFSWFLYDVGTSVSFFEHQPHVPELVDSWLSGYRRVLSLPAADAAEIWTFIMFRRLLLVAWIGSHQGADIAPQLGVAYTQDSCDLADRFLSQAGKE
ncbi:MAG TPA: phosphotransferase [Streptosporangiaceae bacterium]|nr:phosphotransferase [Streptosporangiaceae bacterium]